MTLMFGFKVRYDNYYTIFEVRNTPIIFATLENSLDLSIYQKRLKITLNTLNAYSQNILFYHVF